MMQSTPKWAFMRWYRIYSPDGNELYLKRLRIIQTPLFALYLHWIYLPDDDRDPHCHPWNFWSFIVKGGYVEHLWKRIEDRVYGNALDVGINIWQRKSFHKMSIEHAHQIVSLARTPTISFILTGRRSRDWGFWTKEGYVPRSQYGRAEGHGPDPFMS